MLTGIRVVLFSLMISVAAAGLCSISDEQSRVTMENKYVSVFVAPPRNDPAGFEAWCRRTTREPYVELFVRTFPIAARAGGSSGSTGREITARFGKGKGRGL